VRPRGANGRVSDIIEAWGRRYFVEFVLTVLLRLDFSQGGVGHGWGTSVYLDFRMVWGDAKAHKAIWHWERFVHIDMRIGELAEDAVGRVEAGRTGADHGQAERPFSSLRLLRYGGITPRPCELR